MAKTEIVAGTDGAVTAAGFNIDLDVWSAAVEVETKRWRTFSGVWKKSRIVSLGMSGSFEGVVQYDDASTAPMPTVTGGGINDASFAAVALTLTAVSGCTYAGTANITGVDIKRGGDDVMRGTFKFEFDGQPTQTWDETP